MASITWGSWRNTSSNGMRVGYRVSRSSVSSGSSSVKFTVRIYTQNKYPFADNQHISYGSYLGSNTSFYNGSSGGAVHRATKTYTYSYSDYGRSRTLTSRATVGGVWSGLTPSVTIRLAVPARPYRRPLAPTGLLISSQVSSGALWLNWNNRSQSSNGRPYTSQRIEYSYYHSSGSWTGWSFLATVSSGASSYRYSSMYSNTRYQFRVRANNRAGSSGWSGNVVTNTVPAAPSSARASVESTGDSIRVTWTRNNRRDDGVIRYQIMRQTASGGSWSTVVTKLSGGTSSWVDTSPNAGYNRYRVRAYLNNDYLLAYSSWSTAPSITTIVPPAAPTGVRVSPRVPDFTLDTEISWQHNHGGDGADQTEYIIGYSTDEGATWDELTAETSSQQATIPAETVANGVTVLFRVRTRGNRTETFGPWSQNTQIEGWTTPTVSIDDDMPAEIVQTIPFDVAWTYNQDENRAQLSAVVEVWSVDADGERSERVVRDLVTGDAAQHEITEVLDDEGVYVVRVRATSSREQISAWSEVTVTIDLLPPARVDLRPQYDHETGVMVLEVEPYEPRYGVEVARNLITNPAFRDGLTGWSPSSSIRENVDVVPADDIFDTSGNAVRVFVPGNRTANNDIDSTSMDGSVGQWVAVAGEAQQTGDSGTMQFQYRIRRSNGTWSYPHMPITDIGAGTRLATAHQIPTESDGGVMSLRISFRDQTSNDNTVYATNFVVAVADTEAEALEAIAGPLDGSLSPTATHAFRWAGEPDNSPSIKYELIDATADEEAVPFEAGIDTFDVQRSIDDSEWITILAGVDATQVDEGDDEGSRIISLMDLLPTISGTNEYRLLLRSVSPSTGHTSPQTVSIGPQDNRGWAFLNYGPNMGNVLRVGNKLSIDEPVSQTGENVPIQGRSRPISLYGEHESRSLSVSGVLYHDEPAAAPSPGSPLDSPPNDWRRAQREANTVCIRTPLGHRVYGRLAGVDFGSEQLNLTSLSFTVEENDFREEESSGAGVEVVS